MVRFLKYEKKVFIDKVRERNVRRTMLAITLVTFIPSVFIGLRMVRVSVFEAVADKYVAQVFAFQNTRVIECAKFYGAGRKPSRIELLLVGETLTEDVIGNAEAQLERFGLKNTELVVRQASGTDRLDLSTLQKNYVELLGEKNRRIAELQSQIERYRVVDAGVHFLFREFGNLERILHVFAHRHMRIQRVVLEHHRDVAIFRLLVVAHDAVDLQRAAANVLQTRDHAQRRGLATP